MKRPQSAKPGYKGYWGQNSTDEFNDNGQASKAHRKQVRLVRPDLTTNDFARVLPKKIYQDKERLYSEGLQLKSSLNEALEQNTRLKTKISILEKERDKMSKYLQMPENKTNSRLQSYAGKTADKENLMIRNLKRLIRECRQQNEILRAQNCKIKKAVKYTKINQLQIERKMLLDQNKRMNEALQGVQQQLQNQQDAQQEMQQLNRRLQDVLHQKKQLAEDNQECQLIIEELNQKIKNDTEKAVAKDRKLTRELTLERRKVVEAGKRADDLRREIKSLRESTQVDVKRKILNRPILHPTMNQMGMKKVTQIPKDNFQEQTQLKNQQLQEELREVKIKLEKAEAQLKRINQGSRKQKTDNSAIKINTMNFQGHEESPRMQAKLKESACEDGNMKGVKGEEKAEEHKTVIEDKRKGHEPRTVGKQANNKSSESIDDNEYKDDFQHNQINDDDSDIEPLYNREEEEKPKSKGKTESSKKDKKKGKGYKPDKKKLAEIKQLLTYRMRAQRYPFQQLQKDIQAANEEMFVFEDLSQMLTAQPFYLTPAYTRVFLNYCYESDGNHAGKALDCDVLINKLHKVVGQFVLLEEKEEKAMIQRVVEMTLSYPNELETAFENIKNGEQTVAKADLVNLFRKLELEENFIDLIVTELSLCSDDMEHLNFLGYFERFYIEEGEFKDGDAISEKQSEESEPSHRESKLRGDKKSLKPISQPVDKAEDSGLDIIEDDSEINEPRFKCRAQHVNKQIDMTDSPSQIYKRSQDRPYTRSGHDPHRFSLSPEDSEIRGYGSSQPQLQERKIFGFEIFVDNDVLAELSPQQWFVTLSQSSGVQLIRFNADLTIPDLDGRNIQIYDVDMQKKYHCCRAMLNDVHGVYRSLKKESFAVIIFVPEGMVSLLIGTKGHQINKIMKESHTTIVVNQPINKMTYRTAKIQGYHAEIAKACRIIYQILEQKSSIAYSIEKEPSQLDYTKAKVKAKFIFSQSLVSFLEKKKKTLLKRAEEQTKCQVRFETDRDSRLLKKEESVCVFLGRLEDVQAMLVMIINIAHDFLSDDKRNIDYTLKMIIPANYVTKLIGQKGYMIRDITERSGGSQIKILSDKQSQRERDNKECIITINGTRQNKIDATCFILEQIECFKNGGPILQSGKSINENLAQQFKNSLPLHNDEKLDSLGLERLEIIERTVSGQRPTEKISEKVDKLLESNKHKFQFPFVKMDSVSGKHQVIGHIKQQQRSFQIDTVMLQEQPRTLEESVRLLQASLLRANPNAVITNSELVLSKPTSAPLAIAPSVGSLSEEEGLISQQEQEKQGKIRGQQQEKRPLLKQQLGSLSKNERPSRSRASNSESISKSRSRDRKKTKKGHERKNRSSSSSVQFKHEREFVELRLVIPRKLANDYKELKYIENLCKSELAVTEQKVQGSGQAILSIRGNLRDNSQCLRLLQKRLARMKTTTASSAR